MKSESNDRQKLQVRIGGVVKESYLPFPKEMGGDLYIEPGDKVIVLVLDEGKDQDLLFFRQVTTVITERNK